MKKSLFKFPVLCFVFIFLINAACSEEDLGEESTLITTAQQIAFPQQAEKKTMHINTNEAWEITSSSDWCNVSPENGTGGEMSELTITVEENTETQPRESILTLKTGSFVKEIKITQAQKHFLIVKKGMYDIETDGGSITVELQVTQNPVIKINDAWITQSSLKTVSDIETKFEISPSQELGERTGTITFTVGYLTETVTICQQGSTLFILEDKEGMDNDAMSLVENMHLGWNLGKSLESCDKNKADETMWGNPKVTKGLIDAVKAAGFNTIRIPCAWSGYIENESTYKLKSAWLNRVKEAVDYCISNEMYVILNIDWDGGWLEENPTYDKQEEVNRKQMALWQQIAVYFRDYDEHLLFAGTSGVCGSESKPSTENITVQHVYNQTFVDAVRSTGGKNTWRNLLIQGYDTEINHTIDYLAMPQDNTPNRLMIEVHYFDPWDFCGQVDSDVYLWGKEFSKEGVLSWGQEDWVDTSFKNLKTNFIDKNIPVILGEYGAILRSSLPAEQLEDHTKARNYYLNYITKTALSNGIVPVYWDDGNTGNNGFGLFNRTSYSQTDPDAITAIVNTFSRRF